MFITETFNSPIPYLLDLTFFKSPLKDIFLLIFKRFYLFIFRQRGRKGERKERNISVCLPLEHPRLGTWPSNQAYALTGNQTGNSLVLRPALNPLSHTNLGCFFLILERGERKKRERERMRERENERERKTLLWERNIIRLSSILWPDQGSNQQFRHVHWLGIESATFGVWNHAPTNWTTRQGSN